MASIIPAAKLRALENLPRAPKYATHIWADHIELLCLANEDREFSKADALDRFRERSADLGEDFGEADDDEELLPAEIGSTAEKNDRWTQWIDDWFRQLEYRKGAFADFYPFSFSPKGDALIAGNPLSLQQKFYIFLLLSSSLRHFDKPLETPLTSNFELVSSEAMKKLLPSNAEVHIFGANALHQGKYTGNLWNKIRGLAEDLRERVLAAEADFSPYDTGDKGLDVVGWVPFPDLAPGLPIYFAQCGCTAEWVEKQHSCSRESWNRTMTFCCPPGKVAFIPYCFRNSDGGWHKEIDIHCTIIIDRLRLTYLLQDRLQHFEPLRSRQIVEEILQQRDPLF